MTTTTWTEALIVDRTSGHVMLKQVIRPQTDGGSTLGAATTAFADLFLKGGGTINFNNGNLIATHSSGLLNIGGDLTWSGASATSFTPAITANTGTFTSVSATGRYKRLGKYCLVQIVITITTNGTAASKIFATLPDTVSQEAIFHARNKTTGNLLHAFAAPSATQAIIITPTNGYPGADATTLVVSGMFETA